MEDTSRLRNLNLELIKKGKLLYTNYKFENSYRDMISTKIFLDKNQLEEFIKKTAFIKGGASLIKLKLISKTEGSLLSLKHLLPDFKLKVVKPKGFHKMTA